jgi:hypothetical protein
VARSPDGGDEQERRPGGATSRPLYAAAPVSSFVRECAACERRGDQLTYLSGCTPLPNYTQEKSSFSDSQMEETIRLILSLQRCCGAPRNSSGVMLLCLHMCGVEQPYSDCC